MLEFDLYIQCTLSNIVSIVPTNLQVQVEQFANLYQDEPNCSVGTLVEVLSTFGKNKSQKMLLPDAVKVARFFLVMPAKKASSERTLSVMKRIKMYLRNFTTNNRLNYCMAIDAQGEDVRKMKTIKIARSSMNTVRRDYAYSVDFKYFSIVSSNIVMCHSGHSTSTSLGKGEGADEK